MNSNEILNKYINLIDKGYCSDCNELNCIDNFPHAKITHAIRELQQQCKKQKEVIDKAKSLNEEISHIIYEDFLEENVIGCKYLYERVKKQLDILKEVE